MTPTAGPSPRRARWLIVASLLAAAFGLAAQIAAPVAVAQAPAAQQAAGGGVFAVSAQITSGTYGIYLVDPANGTMALYEWLPSPRQPKLRLLAARNYRFDLQLDEYNTEPSPREIQDLVSQARRLSGTVTTGEAPRRQE